MSLPVSDTEFMEIVNRIAKALKGRFGHTHASIEDFSQEICAWSLQAMSNYDSSRSLEAFLYANAKNRALNFVRDHVTRFDPPCKKCHSGHPCGPDGNVCRAYAAWAKRNQRKASLSRVLPAETSPERPTGESPVEDEVLARELADKIEAEMPPKLLVDYKKLLAGDWREVTHARRARIQKLVAEIVGDPSLVTLKSLSQGCYSSRSGISET